MLFSESSKMYGATIKINTVLPLVTFSKVASGIASLGTAVVDDTVAELHFISLIHILDTLWKVYN